MCKRSLCIRGNVGVMRMENDGLVQECGYLYFRNITVIAMRRIDRRGAPLSMPQS